jgi:hypothetical protein
MDNAIDKPVTRINESWAAEMPTSIRGDAPIRMSPHVQDRGVGSARISPAVSAKSAELGEENSRRIRAFLKRKA